MSLRVAAKRLALVLGLLALSSFATWLPAIFTNELVDVCVRMLVVLLVGIFLATRLLRSE
jgi:hypothetical protein